MLENQVMVKIKHEWSSGQLVTQMCWAHSAYSSQQIVIWADQFRVLNLLLEIRINQWFSLRAILLSRGYLAISSDIFSCHHYGEEDYWHLVGRAQRCCQTFCTSWDRYHLCSPTRNYLNINSDQLEKP